MEKSPPLMRKMKQWYGTYVYIRFQIWLEPTLLQTKITISTPQQFGLFQQEEETVPQWLESCVHILLTWDPRWKSR